MKALHTIALHFGISPKIIDRIGERFQFEICQYYHYSTAEGYKKKLKHEPWNSYDKRMRQTIDPLVAISPKEETK